MNPGRSLGNLLRTARSLGDKPGKAEKVLKSGVPRKPGRSTVRGQTDKRMGDAAALLQKVLG